MKRAQHRAMDAPRIRVRIGTAHEARIPRVPRVGAWSRRDIDSTHAVAEIAGDAFLGQVSFDLDVTRDGGHGSMAGKAPERDGIPERALGIHEECAKDRIRRGPCHGGAFPLALDFAMTGRTDHLTARL